MKKYKYDLHIHSALSPCADILMSPNNILNMAYLNELDIVAITDQNSLKQTFVSSDLARSYQFLYVFGVEVASKENYHILCFFRTIEDAKDFDHHLEMDFHDKDKKATCHDQIIFDEYDNELYQYQQNLFLSSSFGVKEIKEMVDQKKGITVLAHVERYSREMILEALKNSEAFHAFEINKRSNYEEFLKEYPKILNHKVLRNSDSHFINQMTKEHYTIELDDLNVSALFEYFRREGND